MTAEYKPRIDFENRTPLEKVIPLSTPYLVFLDPSDKCNLHCKFCPTGTGEALKYKKPHIMSLALYYKIISDLCDMPEPVKTLRLYSDGEPLLNPNLPSMVFYAKVTVRFGKIDTTTNGSLLNPNLNERLVDSGLDRLIVSVPVDYTVRYARNVEHFYKVSRESSCEVYVKIIGTNLSQDDIDCFLKTFRDISDRIFIENLSPCWPGYDIKTTKPITGIYGQEPNAPRVVCPYVFYSLKINSDGTVSNCFLDWRHSMILGDLNHESFGSVWNGVLLRAIQIIMLRGHRAALGVCGSCGQLQYGAPDNIDPFAEMLCERIENADKNH